MKIDVAAYCYDNESLGKNILSSALAHTTEYGETVYQSGTMKLSLLEGKDVEGFIKKLQTLGKNKLFFQPFQQQRRRAVPGDEDTVAGVMEPWGVDDDSGTKSAKLLFEDGFINLSEYASKGKTNAVYVGLESRDPIFTEKANIIIKEYLEFYTDEEKTAKKIHCIVQRHGGLDVEEMGEMDSPVIRDNYEEHVANGYDKIILDLNNKDPSGRFVILDGPPGTGKTYLIRGIVSDDRNKDVVFVLLPPKYIESLMDASLTTVIHEFKQGFDKDITICLLVEDADILLTERIGGNIDAISAALNLGDGIFGQMFDVRIIASTNTPLRSIDPALLRPGRLSARVEISDLTEDTANKVFKRLTKEEGSFSGKTSLASVYQKAAKHKHGSSVSNILFEAKVEEKDIDKFIL